VLNVEQWAELRRLHVIDKVGIRELARRTGLHRKTIRRALRSANPPKYARPRRPSKLDDFKPEVHRLLTRRSSKSTCARCGRRSGGVRGGEDAEHPEGDERAVEAVNHLRRFIRLTWSRSAMPSSSAISFSISSIRPLT
jgi:transposase